MSNESIPLTSNNCMLLKMVLNNNTNPDGSEGPSLSQETRTQTEHESAESVQVKEIAIRSVDLNTGATTSFAAAKSSLALSNLKEGSSTSSVEPPQPFMATISYINEINQNQSLNQSVSLILIKKGSSNPNPITTQPLRTFSHLPSPISINIPGQNIPHTLFAQALAKLNDSTTKFTFLNLKSIPPVSAQSATESNRLQLNSANAQPKPALNDDLSAPESLTSAPPSYSFVLRQMATRRRPRLMGTFIPSPSFIQHTPPPNYAAAFDIYVDNPMPPPPPRIFHFGFTSSPAVCPECGYTGLTVVITKITLCTHLCAFILCLFCCWLCAPLPYLLRSCKDVYHYCRNCHNFLGMYCPTSAENSFPS